MNCFFALWIAVRASAHLQARAQSADKFWAAAVLVEFAEKSAASVEADDFGLMFEFQDFAESAESNLSARAEAQDYSVFSLSLQLPIR